jgi:hypothetical protein
VTKIALALMPHACCTRKMIDAADSLDEPDIAEHHESPAFDAEDVR